MIIGVVKELFMEEKRVAITPEVVKKITEKGINVLIEKNAGDMAGFSDENYIINGAEILDSPKKIYNNSSILFKIWAPTADEIRAYKYIPLTIADFRYFTVKHIPFRAFALEKIPRISRVQNMDILSSQDNLCGYKAAISAANILNKCIPMMITSAGTLPPLKILVWGLGVAGLQAASTMQRLGGKVFASDIREETKEQAASVGALFLPTENIPEKLSVFDIIITAAGNGENAPVLIDKYIFSHISPSAIVMDISGNVEKSITSHNIIRKYNLTSDVANSSSKLFANNLYNFFCYIFDFAKQEVNLNFEDEIINQTYIGERRNV